MYYLSIGAIFRDENPWLTEWLDYHLAVGIEHFYLYNNDTNPETSNKILQPYVDRRLVEVRHTPGIAMQLSVWREIMMLSKYETEWIAMIDLDEFLLPRQCDDVRTVLMAYEPYSGLVVNWLLFGSNNLEQRPPNQINHFLRRAETSFEMNRHIKSIVRPKHVIPESWYDPHSCAYQHGFAVNENHCCVEGSFNDYSGEIIRLNHYSVRSRQDFFEIKRPRRRADTGGDVLETLWTAQNLNDVFDDEISRRFGHLPLQNMTETIQRKQ